MDASSAHTAREIDSAARASVAGVAVGIGASDSSPAGGTESITNGVGFRNDISYGSIAPPVTYVLFAAFIILMKAATVYAMRGLKQAK